MHLVTEWVLIIAGLVIIRYFKLSSHMSTAQWSSEIIIMVFDLQ